MKLVIPGKTFLVGEYAVLVGGNALGLATEPYFEFDFSQPADINVHEKSAAGLFLRFSDQAELKINSVINLNPSGGFGQSTAEFIACWVKHQVDRETPFSIRLEEMFNQYRDLYNLNHDLIKIKPSGADLVIQILGGVVYFDPVVKLSKSFNWPFNDLDFDIIATGLNVPTHDHLRTLDLKKLEPLCLIAETTIKTFQSHDQTGFLESMKEWTQKLQHLKLQHNHSLKLKKILENCPEVILAKPNGALGAETMTIFYKQENKTLVRDYFKKRNVRHVTGLDRLAQGAHYVD